MTNEEKAKEITENDVCCVWNTGCPNVYHAAIKMAKWKEQQMIEKAQDFLANWFYKHPHADMVCSDEFKNIDDLLEKLKKANW